MCYRHAGRTVADQPGRDSVAAWIQRHATLRSSTPTRSCGPTSPSSATPGGMSSSAARSSRTRRLRPNMASSSAIWPVRSATACAVILSAGRKSAVAPRRSTNSATRHAFPMPRSAAGNILGCCSRWSRRRSCSTNGSGTGSDRTCKPSKACRRLSRSSRTRCWHTPTGGRTSGWVFEFDRRSGRRGGAAQRRHHGPAGGAV